MKVLVVVDMQNDFITGALGSEEARAIVPKVVRKVDLEIEKGSVIMYTMDTHYEDYLQTPEGKMLPVPHCIITTDGWRIIPELEFIVNRALCWEKNIFGSVDLCAELAENDDITEVEFIGVCTDICVISNAIMLKSMMPMAKITVDSTCCAGVTPEKHEAALEVMRSCQINVI